MNDNNFAGVYDLIDSLIATYKLTGFNTSGIPANVKTNIYVVKNKQTLYKMVSPDSFVVCNFCDRESKLKKPYIKFTFVKLNNGGPVPRTTEIHSQMLYYRDIIARWKRVSQNGKYNMPFQRLIDICFKDVYLNGISELLKSGIDS